jgi:CheY-like chemotaxis protein
MFLARENERYRRKRTSVVAVPDSPKKQRIIIAGRQRLGRQITQHGSRTRRRLFLFGHRRGSRSPRHLPVLPATAHAMSDDRERFLQNSGADGYLEKPVFDSAVLIERVREDINGTNK